MKNCRKTQPTITQKTASVTQSSSRDADRSTGAGLLLEGMRDFLGGDLAYGCSVGASMAVVLIGSSLPAMLRCEVDAHRRRSSATAQRRVVRAIPAAQIGPPRRSRVGELSDRRYLTAWMRSQSALR